MFDSSGSANAVHDLPGGFALGSIIIHASYTSVITITDLLVVQVGGFHQLGFSLIDFGSNDWSVAGNVTVTNLINPGALTMSGNSGLTTNGENLPSLEVASGNVTLFDALSVGSLSVATGASLNAESQPVITLGDVTFAAGATYQKLGNPIFRLGSGNFLTSGNVFGNLQVTGTATALDAVTVDANLEVSAGSLTANDGVVVPSGLTTVSGNALLDLGGATHLADVTVENSAELRANAAITITFEAASTTEVLDTASLTLNGPTLRSSVPGNSYFTNVGPGVTVSLTSLDVQDSDACGGETLVATNSTDSGNNCNWNFATVSAHTLSWGGAKALFRE